MFASNQPNSRAGFEPRCQFKYRKGDAHPLWKPHLIVTTSRGGVKWKKILKPDTPPRRREFRLRQFYTWLRLRIFQRLIAVYLGLSWV